EGYMEPPYWQHQVLSNTAYVPTEMLRWAAQSSPIWFLMPHTVDLATWLTGSVVKKVYATATAGILKRRGVDTLDKVHAVLEFDNGSRAVLDSSWVCSKTDGSVVKFIYQVEDQYTSLYVDVINESSSVVSTSDLLELAPEGDLKVGEVLRAPPERMIRA